MIFQRWGDTVPITGLPNRLHQVFLAVGVGIVGSMIVGILFPRIFAPLYIKFKKILHPGYKNAYIEQPRNPLTVKKYLTRGIYCVLLLLGLYSFVIPLIDPQQWNPEGSYEHYINEGVNPRYSLNIMLGFIGLLMAIVVGLWSIAWALEDSGLTHYKFFDQEGNELREIEPIKNKYASFLKGYAGITSILFLIEVMFMFGQVGDDRVAEITWLIFLPIIGIGFLFPVYLLYAKVGGNHKYLRKKLPMLRLTLFIFL